MNVSFCQARLSLRETLRQWFRTRVLHKTLPAFLFSLEKFTAAIYRAQYRKCIANTSLPHSNIPAEWKEGIFHKTIVLMVNGRGGGADVFTQNKASQLTAQGTRVFFAYYNPLSLCWVVSRHTIHHPIRRHYLFPWRYSELIQLFRHLRIEEVHIHGTRFLPFYYVQDMSSLAALLNARLEYFAHDFTSICPRLHLFDENYRYCGMPQDAAACNHCIQTRGRLVSGAPLDIRRYRHAYTTLLEACGKITAPSNDTVARIHHYLPQLRIEVEPHTPISEVMPITFPPAGARRQIGIIGAIQRHKGADVLLACVRDAKERNLPLDFFVFGSTCYDRTLRSLGCTISGRYKEEELSGLLQKNPCPIAFLPSTWQETFCHTLTHALSAGMHPVVFDFGAPAERLRKAGCGTLLPHRMMDEPRHINDRLLAIDIVTSQARE